MHSYHNSESFSLLSQRNFVLSSHYLVVHVSTILVGVFPIDLLIFDILYEQNHILWVQSSFMLFYMYQHITSLFLYYSFYKPTKFYLCICWLDIWVISTLGLLWTLPVIFWLVCLLTYVLVFLAGGQDKAFLSIGCY